MMRPNSHVKPKLFSLVAVFLVLCFESTNAVSLRAYISQHGLHGEIEFVKNNETSSIIRTNLQPTLQYPDQVWRWALHEFPVDYTDTSAERCSEQYLGKEVVDLTEELGYLIIPGKDHAEFESNVPLTGVAGFWGKSIVLKTAEHDRVICASIFSIGDKYEKHAEAKFTAPVAGIINMRWLKSKEENIIDGYIHTDLYHTKEVTDKGEFTQHRWKIFVTDVFDPKKENHEDNCNALQLILDPGNKKDSVGVGDLDGHFGLVKIATDGNKKKFKEIYKNNVLNTLRDDIDGTQRRLYVVLYELRGEDSFLGCAQLRTIEPRSTKAIINMDGIKGEVEFTQRSPFDITWALFTLGASNGDYEANLRFVGSMTKYLVKELPQKLLHASQIDHICNTTGAVYNPTGIEEKDVPPAGLGTQDQYPVGDLLGKYKQRTEYLNHKYLLPGLANELSGSYWDVFLPLHGRHSVVHRSVVLERQPPRRDICASILPYRFNSTAQVPLASAEVIFRYPLVGRIVFRQPAEQPWEDTTIIVESLIHADGANINNTFEHRWAIHENAPGKDYYNWTASPPCHGKLNDISTCVLNRLGRCLSAGKVYEPFGIAIDARHPEDYCRRGLEGLCRRGDFTTRHGNLAVAGRKIFSLQLTRRLFTDSIISLSGKHSIMRKSLVIYDDHGPVARGERMACSIINGHHRRKAVVRDWFGNGETVTLKGKVEMIQQSEYDPTNVEVQIKGLEEDVRNYKIHVAPVEKDLEFPCERTTLYDTYNPFNVSKSLSPPATKGTADQYELGDLGEKYGLLEAQTSLSTFYNDTQVALFGPYSVLGRSMVLHKKSKGRRWACSSIERGYSPSEAREIRAIASFHHPGGFAWGFIRMTQLIHNDGSASDTIIEVNLRHPGVRDRNFTRNHNWQIFVNPVGVDAAVQVTGTRCVAGGYRWNPYFTQLADPLNHDLYNQECGADNPLRCDVGDLTARLGTIDIGGDRQVFVDSNFPLEGAVTAVGRSIVIFGPERSGERFACANLLPDNDIIKYANIMKPPRFVLGQFLADIRRVMGVPPWMVGVDARRTRTLQGGACVQLLLHFMGPDAGKLELDFTRLLASGRLDEPSVFVPGFIDQKRKRTISYRNCGEGRENNEKTKKSTFSSIFFKSSASRRTPLALMSYVLIMYLARLYM